MSFATFVNIITIIFCLAVLVQSVRMMRSLDTFKGAGAALPQMIEGLDTAAVRASAVLAELKETLRTDVSAHARVLTQAEEIRDELTVMVGIANATADRILDASSKREPEDDAELLELVEAMA